ncbi:hypothetical protein [Clostridium sp. Marseille-Q7071]
MRFLSSNTFMAVDIVSLEHPNMFARYEYDYKYLKCSFYAILYNQALIITLIPLFAQNVLLM